MDQMPELLKALDKISNEISELKQLLAYRFVFANELPPAYAERFLKKDQPDAAVKTEEE